MRSFVDDRKHSKGDNVSTEVTNQYVELEFPLDDDDAFVVYLIPRDDHSAFIATCWDRQFDELIDNMDEDTAETVAETWPTLAALLDAGINDRYREGALIKLEDCDDGEPKWFVVSVKGNLDFEDIPQVAEKTQETVQMVIEKSATLAQELAENEPNGWSQLGRGIGKFVGGAVALGLAAFLGIEPE